MKRIISGLLSLVLCLTLLLISLPARAERVDLFYSITDGEATLTHCNVTAPGKIVVPETVEGCPVTAIASRAFHDCTKITDIVLPKTVKTIGSSAFTNCSQLETVNLPDDLTAIGSGCFFRCSSLKEVHIPATVTSIGAQAFYDCASLTELTIPAGVTQIGMSAFSFCSGLTEIILPEGITEIAAGTFFCCKGLTQVTIPEHVTCIGENAFFNCRALTRVTLPDGIQTIDFNAFTDCNLEYHRYDEGKYLGSERNPHLVLMGTTGTKITGLRIHEDTKIIGYQAVADCGSLTEIVIPEQVTSIGEYAFRSCQSLESIIFPSSVTSIGDFAFYDCSKLMTVYFAGNAPAFGGYVFYGVGSPNGDLSGATAWYHAGTSGWEAVTQYHLDGEYTYIALRQAEHLRPVYTYDNNHTCTADGTERAQCLTCGQWDVRKAEGTAAHRYIDGSCLYCNLPEPGPHVCVLTGRLTTHGKASVHLALTPLTGDTPAVSVTTEETVFQLAAEPGEYVLTVAQEGSVPRTYDVTLRAGETQLNVILHLQGDLSGDGQVNMGDVAKLYAHVNGTAVLTEAYQLLCADFTGDGSVNVGDTAMLYAKVRTS